MHIVRLAYYNVIILHSKFRNKNPSWLYGEIFYYEISFYLKWAYVFSSIQILRQICTWEYVYEIHGMYFTLWTLYKGTFPILVFFLSKIIYDTRPRILDRVWFCCSVAIIKNTDVEKVFFCFWAFNFPHAIYQIKVARWSAN